MRLPDHEFERFVRDARDRHNLSDIIGRHTDLKKRGPNEMVGLCCFHSERTPSLEVNDSKGTYHCHGCGAGGDAITFLTAKEGLSFMDALRWLSGDALPVVSKAERARRKAQSARKLQGRINLARSIWADAVPPQGTAVEVYAKSRGITILLPPTIRFVATPRWRNTETGEVGPNVPAMACALQNRNGAVVGVQCVFLDDGGRRKYERQRSDGSIAKAKLSFGVVVGSALRLGPATREVVVCEGPEDGLSLLQQSPDRSIWVSCGTAGMPRIEFPAAVSKVILAGDNGEAGRTAVDEARSAYGASGLATTEIFPDARFKDWNDELRGIAKP